MAFPFTGCGTALITPFTADGAVDEGQLHLVAFQLAKALGHGLQRTLHVCLHHEVERRRFAALDLLEDVLELGPTARGGRAPA